MGMSDLTRQVRRLGYRYGWRARHWLLDTATGRRTHVTVLAVSTVTFMVLALIYAWRVLRGGA